VLEALSGARNYNAWLAELVRPYLGDDPIEVGAGIGTFSELWLEAGVPRLTVSELDVFAVDELRRRFDSDPRVTIAELDLTDPPEATHSSLAALNVLEHIEDDVAGLRGAARLVRPGGVIAVLVPALAFAMSRFDREIGHHRRYTTTELESAFSEAGLEPLDVHYVNAPGLLGWTVGMKLLRMTPQEGVALRAWDKLVVPPARAFEQRVRPPFGQSVLGLAHRPG